MSSKKIRKADKKRKKQKQNLRKKNNTLRTKFGIEAFDCRHSEFKNIVVSNLEKILGNLDNYFNSAQVRVLRCFYLLNILHNHSNYSKNTIRRTEYTDRVHALFENAFNADQLFVNRVVPFTHFNNGLWGSYTSDHVFTLCIDQKLTIKLILAS